MRICVHWPRLGPYHRARLEAAHGWLSERGAVLAMLETAPADGIYAWRPEAEPTPFERVTVFPGENFDDISPRRMAAGVTEALQRLDPDVVAIHSYSMPDAHACLAWCRRNRRVAVLMNDSTDADAPRVRWREALKSVLVRQYDAALLAGTPQKRYHVRLGMPPDRVRLGYDVVDNAFFEREAAAVRRDPAPVRALPGLAGAGLAGARPYFLASNRFIARKSLDVLLKAYAVYRRRSAAPWRLVLLGSGPLRPQLESIARAEAIDGDVTLAGWQQLDRLPAYYALASAFVHTSLVDQWGLVVNEAMASGLPVVVSTGAGCHEDLVRVGENGFTFAPGDIDGLARHLQALAHEVDLAAFGRRSREVIGDWPLERFARGLHEAALAGRAASHRGLDPRAAALVWTLRTLARTPRSFHSVES